MKVLLTNDDGIKSPGLLAIKQELERQPAYELIVVAPKTAQSAQGCSHAHGDRWINWEETPEGYVVEGSPATCMSVALRELNLQPDIVVSGINFGENLGLNLMYSGTIGAAWEAAMSGFLAVASSLELPPSMHYTLNAQVDFQIAGYFTRKVIEKLLLEKPRCQLWNLNVPTKATKNQQIKEAILGVERWNFPVIRERRHQAKSTQIRFEFDPTEKEFSEKSDISLLRQGEVVLTPINRIIFPWDEHK